MRQIMLLSYSVVLFLLTTFIASYFFFVYEYSMDTEQQMLIGIMCFLGYAASALVVFVWNNERKTRS